MKLENLFWSYNAKWKPPYLLELISHVASIIFRYSIHYSIQHYLFPHLPLFFEELNPILCKANPILWIKLFTITIRTITLLFLTLQCSVWNTWGPIASSAVEAYPALSTSNIATLALWGPITCITGTLFFTVLIQKRGKIA